MHVLKSTYTYKNDFPIWRFPGPFVLFICCWNGVSLPDSDFIRLLMLMHVMEHVMSQSKRESIKIHTYSITCG